MHGWVDWGGYLVGEWVVGGSTVNMSQMIDAHKCGTLTFNL